MMAPLATPSIVLAFMWAGCGFQVELGLDDGSLVPDAGPCVAASVSCASPDVLRTCSGEDAIAVDTACPWGCVSSGTARCGVLQPSGGVIASQDLGTVGLADLEIARDTTLDANTGEIKGIRASGIGVEDGVAFEMRTSGSVFRMASLRVSKLMKLSGDHAVVFIADGPITIDAVIDGRGDPLCEMMGRVAGPGGLDGGEKESTAIGPGGGGGTMLDDHGGGGGGGGAVGGNGGLNTPGGAPFDAVDAEKLVGGGGGGGGGGNANAGTGGGGGAAIQFVSNTSITIGSSGGINAGGCGGDEGGGGSDGGGGGGAGGMIVLEAPVVTIAGRLAVNGGGGGTHGAIGSPATLDRIAAPGGSSVDGIGGAGGTGAALSGVAAASGTYGGGGGSVGRIRIKTRSGTTTITSTSLMSPALDDSPTTATASQADID
ncbi:MAG: hypothetical protein ACKV2T_00550 [Kofleriaceae bacterium]